MRYQVTEFAFELPDGWTHANDANRLVCHGPNREELIATATRVQGNPVERELADLIERLWAHALKAATDATSHPEFVVTSPLVEDTRNPVLPLAIVRARTRDSAVLFCVVTARAEQSVLFVTFEASNDSTSVHSFDAFVDSLRRI
ncbi:MAG TPA: hypothetical protein VGI81_09580 [Tepidisphaeraceae bacterium]|jgi:hypothetical protein